ncbi:MAG: PaaI family thioesterase [Bacillota bacterium]
MESPNSDYRKTVAQAFAQAAFISDVGITLADCGPGWCESVLTIEPRHLQHTGIIHAGVQTTMADHTAGAAAISITREDEVVLTVEFKLHLLRPGIGEQLWCRAQVLKPGRKFHVVESEVYALTGDKKSLVSKLTGTMAVLPARG